MRRSWAAATVGVLAIVVGLMSYFLIKATNERSSTTKGYVVWARFKDAAALFQKSRVQTAGIPEGQIEKLELDPGSPEGIVDGQRRPMRELKNGDQIVNVHEPTSMGDLMSNVGDLMPILHVGQD